VLNLVFEALNCILQKRTSPFFNSDRGSLLFVSFSFFILIPLIDSPMLVLYS
jgi:hypothetical protein